MLVNTTHKILSEIQTANPGIVATMPTQQMENILGYDTVFESWKLFLCQYKRPYPHKGKFYYYLDRQQTAKLRIWAAIANSPSAFFPLVLTSSDQHLALINPDLLDNVIFVDVRDLGPTSTMIRVSGHPSRNPKVEFKVLNGPWVAVAGPYIWQDVKTGLEDCKFGEIMRYRQQTTESNSLLRSAISSFDENVLPPWWRKRAGTAFGERFPDQAELFLKFIDGLVFENRKRERPTRITSPSFRAFIYPMKT